MTSNDTGRTPIVDQEHLRLLSLFYYVRAGCTAFFASIPLIHVSIGVLFVLLASFAPGDTGDVPPAFVGWFLIAIGSTIILIGWTLAVLQFLAGRFIARRRHRFFCLVIAGVSCLAIPYGTIIGIMTFIVLSRTSVKALFDRATTV